MKHGRAYQTGSSMTKAELHRLRQLSSPSSNANRLTLWDIRAIRAAVHQLDLDVAAISLAHTYLTTSEASMAEGKGPHRDTVMAAIRLAESRT
jgi:hypothetical protein